MGVILLGIAFWVIIIILGVKASKKKKMKAQTYASTSKGNSDNWMDDFAKTPSGRETINNCIEMLRKYTEFAVDKKTFEVIYDTECIQSIDGWEDRDRKFKELLPTMSELREEYSQAVRALVAISEDNTVLYTTKEQEDEFKQKYKDISSWDDRDKKIADDIIRTIPLLIDYLQAHNKLVKCVQLYLLEICQRENQLWRGIRYVDSHKTEPDPKERDRQKKLYDSCCHLLHHWREYFVRDFVWKEMPTSMQEDSSGLAYHLYLSAYDEDEQSRNRWIDAWLDNLHEIGKENGYYALFVENANFIQNVVEEVGSPDWLDYIYSGFTVDVSHSYFAYTGDLNDSEELMRIRDLYIKGEMKGKYYQIYDPKYRKGNI